MPASSCLFIYVFICLINFPQPCKYAHFNGNFGEVRDGIGVRRTKIFFSTGSMEYFSFHLFYCRVGYGNIWLLKYLFVLAHPARNSLQGAFHTPKLPQWEPVASASRPAAYSQLEGSCEVWVPAQGVELPFLTARNMQGSHLPLYTALHEWILSHE